jgi:pyruvate/2-oxoglutarate dehydrogenase complex dihydrolipoamide acyltransferase (E2) component
MRNIALSFGSISKKPWVVKGKVEVREILHLAVAFNRDVVDGVPAGRFVQDLVRTIEECGFSFVDRDPDRLQSQKGDRS